MVVEVILDCRCMIPKKFHGRVRSLKFSVTIGLLKYCSWCTFEPDVAIQNCWQASRKLSKSDCQLFLVFHSQQQQKTRQKMPEKAIIDEDWKKQTL